MYAFYTIPCCTVRIVDKCRLWLCVVDLRRVVQCEMRVSDVQYVRHTFFSHWTTRTHPDSGSAKFVYQFSSVKYSTVHVRNGKINTDKGIYSFGRKGQRLANATFKIQQFLGHSKTTAAYLSETTNQVRINLCFWNLSCMLAVGRQRLRSCSYSKTI